MKKSLRLLLIEDLEDDALLLVRELRKGGIDSDFTRVDTLRELEAALANGPWDAIFSDYNLPGFTGLDVLRIVREALQNVRRHADARRASIRVAREDDRWIVEVRDDGRGFDVGAVAARGRRNFGLQFMRERAEMIGAEFEVRSRPDGGTVVRIAIPRGAEESR